MATHTLPVFTGFIDDLRTAFRGANGDTQAAMEKARDLLTALVNDETMRAHAGDWPSTEGHKNLLLHEDPDFNFVVNAVVREAGRKGGVHDHAHAWTAYGVLDGEERLERYRRLDDGSREGYCEIELESVTPGVAGVVDLVGPFEIHSEKGGPGRSVAIIVRSERVAETGAQGRYNPETNAYSTGNGPTQIPFAVT